MVQKDLVKAVASDVNAKYKEEGRDKITESVVADVIKSFGQVTSKALSKGDQVPLAGFGTFKVSERAARTGRNPATGETINIPAKKVIKFVAAKSLKEAIN